MLNVGVSRLVVGVGALQPAFYPALDPGVQIPGIVDHDDTRSLAQRRYTFRTARNENVSVRFQK
jgi:hypothetical protein